MKYGLPEGAITSMQHVFAKYPDIDRALLYGSRAKGNFRAGSDIDLTLVGQHIDITQLHRIENELDELCLAYKIDISIFHHISNPNLLAHIARVGSVFYDRSSQ